MIKKAVCNKCNKLIEVDPTSSNLNCPNCKEVIFTDTAIKNYLQAVAKARRKADTAFTSKGDYQEAYKYYLEYYHLREDDLSALVAVVVSKIRCSTINEITIKEATDFLLKGSDKIEIGFENVKTLSDYLIKIKKETNQVIATLNKIKNSSSLTLNAYHEAIKQYKYYLNKYLEIYLALDKFNQYFAESKEIIKEEINKADNLLKEKVEVKNKEVDLKNIFPSKRRFYHIHIVLYVITALGAVLSIVGLILLGTKSNQIAMLVTIIPGLLFFFGGYFVNHYLTSKNKER